ncbi:MAG: hypothetical protein JXC32_01520 [Anaerolineae bacterium]|nr:hypothetical protein [Anaerolineae bacterium]
MFRWLIPTIVAVACGLVVLVGYLVPIPPLASARALLVQWAAVLGAFALLLGYGNLLRVHTGRLFQRESKQRIASLLLVAAAMASLVLVLVQGPDGATSQALVDAVLVPGQSALLAVTGITLILGGMRLVRTRREVHSVLLLIVAAFTLFGMIPIFVSPVLETIQQLVNAAATGGMRGLLLGVTLGVVLTGLRILLGIDRPHSGG